MLALSLQKSCQDVQVDIYESTAELTEIGAGVGMWPRMWEIIEHLGLGDELRQVSGGGSATGALRAFFLLRTLIISHTVRPQLNQSTFARPTRRSPSISSSCPLPVRYFLPLMQRDG